MINDEVDKWTVVNDDYINNINYGSVDSAS